MDIGTLGFNYDLFRDQRPVARGTLVYGRGEHEPDDHVALRLLAYLLFYRDDLKMGKDVGEEYLPDLVALDAAGDLDVWVECGATSLRKVGKLSRRHPRMRLYLLRSTRRMAADMVVALEEELREGARVSVLAFEAGFVDAVAGAIRGRNELYCNVDGGVEVELSINGTFLRSPLYGVGGVTDALRNYFEEEERRMRARDPYQPR